MRKQNDASYDELDALEKESIEISKSSTRTATIAIIISVLSVVSTIVRMLMC